VSEHEKQASVIIPNWNGATLLPSCLDALRRQSVRDFEVIVVDNASTDESCELIDADYPEVRLLQLQRNLGLTGGCNAGIHMAKGEVIALLNNDAEAEAGWLAALIDGLARYPKAGSVASKMLLHDRRDIINSAGDFYGRDGLPGNRGVWQKDEGRYDEEAWVFGACGGAVAYRRSMLNQVGLFDPDFFMYCEDVDLAWRAQLAGWRCRYIPDAVVYHRLSATGGGPLSSFYTGRNTLYVLFKDVPISLRQKYRHLILRTQWRIARDALRAWRGKAARARLRGQLAGMMAWPKMRAKYQVVQRRRKVSDGYLESVLSEPAIEGREKREP
jgi:GT2 family glycosyltransferase